MSRLETLRRLSLQRAGLLVLAFVGVVVIVAWSVRSTAAQATSGQSGMSNPGIPVDVSAQADGALARADAKSDLALGEPRLLAQREGRNVYRVEGANGRCFAAGATEAAKSPSFGVLLCSRSDTAAQQQLVDMSIYDLSTSGNEIRLYRFEGVAADGVTSVGILGAQGAVLARVPVTGNVYVASDPPSAAVTGIVGFNAQGDVVEQLGYSR